MGRAEPDGRDRWAPLVVLLPILAMAVALQPLLAGSEPYGADNSSHFAQVKLISDALAQGRLPGWNPQSNLGFPLGYYYQWLPHLTLAVVHRLGFGLVPLLPLYKLSIVFLLGLVPASFYLAWRPLLGRGEATAAAALSLAVACSHPFGLSAEAYLRSGVWTQLWGFVCLSPALAAQIRWLRGQGRLSTAAAWWAVTVCCHLFFGTLLAVFAVAATVAESGRSSAGPVLRRLAALATLGGMLVAFFVVPALVHRDYFGGWPWEQPEVRDGLSPRFLALAFALGELFDDDRPRVLTILVVVGLLVVLADTIRRRRGPGPDNAHGRFLVLGTGLCLLIVTGRTTWAGWAAGSVLEDVQFGRFVVGIHYTGILLAALALARGTAWLARRAHAALVVVALAVVLVPPYVERAHALRRWGLTFEDYAGKERRPFEALLSFLRDAPPGRVWTTGRTGHPEHWAVYLPAAYAGRPTLVSHALGVQDTLSYFFVEQFHPLRHARLFDVGYVVWNPQGGWYDGRGVKLGESLGEATGWPLLLDATPYQVFGLPGRSYCDVVEVDGVVQGRPRALRDLLWAWFQHDGPQLGRHLLVEAGERSHPGLPVITLSEDGSPRVFDASGQPAGDDLGRALLAPEGPPGWSGHVLQESSGIDRYACGVEAERDAWALLKVSYHPNWRAAVDSVPARVEMLSPSLMGVAVPRGRHRVVFEYRRPAFQAWLLAAALFAFAGIRWRERRSVGGR